MFIAEVTRIRGEGYHAAFGGVTDSFEVRRYESPVKTSETSTEKAELNRLFLLPQNLRDRFRRELRIFAVACYDRLVAVDASSGAAAERDEEGYTLHDLPYALNNLRSTQARSRPMQRGQPRSQSERGDGGYASRSALRLNGRADDEVRGR